MQLKDAIKKRHSVRKFTDKKPNWKKVVRAIDSARFAPMAGNFYSLKFILVSEKDKIHKIGSFCEQNFVSSVPFIIAVISETEKVKNYYKDGEKYSQQQAGAAIQNILLSLAEEGIGACWVETFSEKDIKKILSIPADKELVALIPLGIESRFNKAQPRTKPELEKVLYYDVFEGSKISPETRVLHEDM